MCRELQMKIDSIAMDPQSPRRSTQRSVTDVSVSASTNRASAESMELYLLLHVLTDQLIFFGIRGQGGQVPFSLADMLFKCVLCVCFSHDIVIFCFPTLMVAYSILFKQDVFVVFRNAHPSLWPSALKRWVKQLTYFLSFFPGSDEVRVCVYFVVMKAHYCFRLAGGDVTAAARITSLSPEGTQVQ